MRQRQDQRDLRIAGALAVALFIGLASIWSDHGPSPDGAFALILAYFVAIALWGAIEGMLLLLRRPPPPTPPPEPSRVGALLGPRKPAPLVAHAVPAKDSVESAA